jgi:hypothetical protein
MDTLKLITEQNWNDIETYIEEKSNGVKSLYIKGPFLQSEIKNRNGRIYPEKTMDREASKYVQEQVKTGRAFGELGHPDGPQINLDRISHRITELTKDGTNWVGKALVMNTPMGNIARGIMEGGGKLGVSSRGMGSIRQSEGANIVGDDFMLATAGDIVADPSAPDAWVDGVMEGKEWVWDNGILVESTVAQYKTELQRESVHSAEKRASALFEDFMNRLRKS